MNLETETLRGRPRNRRQDDVREDGRLVSGKGWKERLYKRGMEEAPEKGKESSHSAYANGMND
jgi:ssDNA-binding replication factor A large subunit